MNNESAAKFLPLVKALAEGKTIQVDLGPSGWTDEQDPIFTLPVGLYRIKPEKKLVPLGPEDVPPGSFLKPTNSESTAKWAVVLAVSHDAMFVPSQIMRDGTREMLFKEALENGFQILRPGKTEWEPCSKEIEA